jgi:gluconokinase
MNNYLLIWIIIGASGSGKSTIGRLLSQWLECDFCEGDRRHSPENILKMSSDRPLQDEDRHSSPKNLDRLKLPNAPKK